MTSPTLGRPPVGVLLPPLPSWTRARREHRLGQMWIGTAVVVADLAFDINRGQLTTTRAERETINIARALSTAAEA